MISTRKKIFGLRVDAHNLTRGDNRAALASGSITARPPAFIPANTTQVIPIRFDLSQAPSGEYPIELLLIYKGGREKATVSVKVRDRPEWPLAVLAIGLLLGFGLSLYRDRGMPRDQLRLRLDRMAERLHGAVGSVAESFRLRAAESLAEAEVKLQAGQLEEAQAAVKRAEETWNKWSMAPSQWTAMLAYHAELSARVAPLDPNAYYVQQLRRQLQQTSLGAAEENSPVGLGDKLETTAKHIHRYTTVSQLLDDLDRLIGSQVPADQTKIVGEWREALGDLRRRLGALDPTALDTNDTDLEGDIKDAFTKLRRPGGPPGPYGSSGGLESTTVPQWLATERYLGLPESPPPARSTHSAGPRRPTFGERFLLYLKGPDKRLLWYEVVGYTIAVVFLLWGGYRELYDAKATFGADAVGDYLALFAYGIAAEAARSSFVVAVRNPGSAAIPDSDPLGGTPPSAPADPP